jgi:hypothetical protein
VARASSLIFNCPYDVAGWDTPGRNCRLGDPRAMELRCRRIVRCCLFRGQHLVFASALPELRREILPA